MAMLLPIRNLANFAQPIAYRFRVFTIPGQRTEENFHALTDVFINEQPCNRPLVSTAGCSTTIVPSRGIHALNKILVPS